MIETQLIVMVTIVRLTFLSIFEMKDYRLPWGYKNVNHCVGHVGRGSRIGQLTINTYKISMVNKQNGLAICVTKFSIPYLSTRTTC